MGDSMGSLIGLKKMIMFSAVLLTIGSVSAQQAFAIPACNSMGDGNWNNSSNWFNCDGGTPDISTNADIQGGNNIIITGDEETEPIVSNTAENIIIFFNPIKLPILSPINIEFCFY